MEGQIIRHVLVTYLEDNLKYHIKKNILLLKNKEDKFFKIYYG